MRNVIIHYHIFKNAGTSIDRILSENFGSGWVTFEGATPTSLLPSAMVEEYLVGHPEVQALSSHLARPPLPKGMNVLPIVFLRHPVDRAFSAYKHERRSPPNVKSSEVAQHSDFRGYVKWCLKEGRSEGGILLRNYQVVHLSASSFRESHIYKTEARPQDLEEVLRLLSNIPFFGLVEEFDLCLQLLQKAVVEFWPDFKVLPVRENASTCREEQLADRLQTIRDELGEELWTVLIRENQLDLQLYNAAYAQLREAAGRYGIREELTSR